MREVDLLLPLREMHTFLARSLQSLLHLIQQRRPQLHLADPAGLLIRWIRRFALQTEDRARQVGLPHVEVPAWWRLVEEFEFDREQWDASLPGNWRRLSLRELKAVSRTMERTGWVLAWVPGEEILLELIESPDRREANGRLLARQDDVLDDLKRCLAEITDSPLTDLSVALHQGVRSYEWGYSFPAQAIAAVVLTSLVKQELEANRDGGSPLLTFRRNSLLRAGGTALTSYWPSPGDPVPSLFHPYVTAEHLDLTHFNQANALAGLMLSVSFLRDLQAVSERD
jgi:hypothetical protein